MNGDWRDIWVNDPDGRSAKLPNGTKVTIAYDAPFELGAAMTVAVLQAWDESFRNGTTKRLRAVS